MYYRRNRDSWKTDPYLRSLHHPDHQPAPLGPFEPLLDFQPRPAPAPKNSPPPPTPADAHTTPRPSAPAGHKAKAGSRTDAAASSAPDAPVTRCPDAPISPEVSFLETLESLSAYIRDHLVCSDQQLTVLVLWIIHTYGFDVLPITSYLNIYSPERQSGKSVCMGLLFQFSSRVWMPSGITSTRLMNRIANSRPTLLLDDWHTAFRSSDAQAIIGFLAAGSNGLGNYSTHPGDKDSDESTLCPKAFAGIGTLPASLAERSIPIRLKRRKPSESALPIWMKRHNQSSASIAGSLKKWADNNRDRFADALLDIAETSLPDLNMRQQECAWPLLAVAQIIGGKWPKKARNALVGIFKAHSVTSDSPGVQLLSDIRDFFAQPGRVQEVFTTDLLEHLNSLKNRSWQKGRKGSLDPNGFRSLLRDYEVPCAYNVVISGKRAKGFRAADFRDAWERYLPRTIEIDSDEAAADNSKVVPAGSEVVPEKPEVVQKGSEVVPEKPEAVQNSPQVVPESGAAQT